MADRKEHVRHSRRITRGPRWKALRMQALERDGWQCVRCGTRHRLEIDHIEPVKDRPDLAYSLSNLQCLCGRCHGRKTRIEIGLGRPDPKREAWKKLVRQTGRNPVEHERKSNA